MKAVWMTLILGACMTWTGVVRAQPQAQQLVLGISEGTSGGLDHAQVIAKYQGLAEVVARAMKAKVNVVFAREFKQLEEGMQTGRFDFVMARPSDYPARGMRDYGYSYIAGTKPDGQCFMIVPKGSTLKSIADVKGKRIVLPEQVAYMSRFCSAELRDQGIHLDKENVQFVREQAAVGFYLDNKFADVGAVASYSGIAKKWEKDGNRILHKSVAQPYFPLVAHKRIRPEQIKAIQAELIALPDSEAGKEVLKRIGIQQFDTGSEARMRELLKWLNI
ncbi:MAG: PhnD/SsuA/transferrin family substrate-binding protein [Polaromonas sp.]|uniref:phosphate/phosphite/phosphonate ABC transporter substrate-binding protein n=1 Tax=Polaromonas sp. TaxID=1869339 RepID=UPI0027190CD1|nr:PhnD/SsuA/transferrin family substrate-binding protein [Polaromonas sp.]MDO9114484.1 PhnD/SsuA/transferrin family substrate-binding protein [Polaromonas sp.]MDP1888466.1 PhnD/SsuA/transferrin family substrate-binding protein [Polaromonas sp.]